MVVTTVPQVVLMIERALICSYKNVQAKREKNKHPTGSQPNTHPEKPSKTQTHSFLTTAHATFNPVLLIRNGKHWLRLRRRREPAPRPNFRPIPPKNDRDRDEDERDAA